MATSKLDSSGGLQVRRCPTIGNQLCIVFILSNDASRPILLWRDDINPSLKTTSAPVTRSRSSLPPSGCQVELGFSLTTTFTTRTNRIRCASFFYAAAEYDSVSLNLMLLKGPNYFTSLNGFLLRLGVKRFPVSADIENMFYQVKVPPVDRSALGFYWRTPGSDAFPEVYQLTVNIFGAVCSPSICTFALRIKFHHDQKVIIVATASCAG